MSETIAIVTLIENDPITGAKYGNTGNGTARINQ